MRRSSSASLNKLFFRSNKAKNFSLHFTHVSDNFTEFLALFFLSCPHHHVLFIPFLPSPLLKSTSESSVPSRSLNSSISTSMLSLSCNNRSVAFRPPMLTFILIFSSAKIPVAAECPQVVAAVLAACYLSSGSWRCFSRVLHQNSCLPGFPQKASGFREGERGCGSTHAQSELYKTSQPQFTKERRTFTSSTDSGKSHSSKIQRNSQRSPRLGRNNALQHFGLANAPNSCSFFQPSPFFLHLSFPNSDVFLVSFHTQPVHFRFHSFHVFPQPTAEKVCIMHSFQNKYIPQ